MLQKRSLFALLLGITLLAACAPRIGFFKITYLDGAVVVDHMRNLGGSGYFTFRFQEKGIFWVTFSAPPGKEYGGEWMPQNLDKIIVATSREIVVGQRNFPVHLRVEITHDDGKHTSFEAHDFYLPR